LIDWCLTPPLDYYLSFAEFITHTGGFVMILHTLKGLFWYEQHIFRRRTEIYTIIDIFYSKQISEALPSMLYYSEKSIQIKTTIVYINMLFVS